MNMNSKTGEDQIVEYTNTNQEVIKTEKESYLPLHCSDSLYRPSLDPRCYNRIHSRGASRLIKKSFDSWSESPVKTTIETLPISDIIKFPRVSKSGSLCIKEQLHRPKLWPNDN